MLISGNFAREKEGQWLKNITVTKNFKEISIWCLEDLFV